MKKNSLAIIPAIILVFASTQLMAAGGRGDKGHKIIDSDKFTPVCHKVRHPRNVKGKNPLPESHPQPFLLWVPKGNAYEKHLAHGDDDAFEIGDDEYTCECLDPETCDDD